MFFVAFVLSLMMLTAPLLADGRTPPVPMERDNTLDTLPLGLPEMKKAAPGEERVNIRKEGIPASATTGKKDPLVTIDSPGQGKVSRSYQKVTGRVGGGITKAFLRINDDTQVVAVDGGSFDAYAALKPGANVITALAWDLGGDLGKDTLKVLYEPESDGPAVELTAPKDGTRLDITADRVITVTARSGKDVKGGYLILNNIPRKVSFKNGVMKQELALLPGTNEITVEAEDAEGRAGISRPVKVYAFDARPKDLVAVLTWDSADADFDLHVWDSFGHHTFNEAPDPALSEAAIPAGKLDMDRKGGYGPEVFSLETASAEVYTFYSRYNPGMKEKGAGCYLRLILYGDEPSRRIMRSFGPVRMDAGKPLWEAAHVKMPEGVFFQEKGSDLEKTLGMDVKAVRRLALMLAEENPAFKLLAISAMGQIKSEEAIPPLLEALSGGTPDIRRAAAGALYNIKSSKAVDGLMRALNDEDPTVRAAAAGALGNIGDKKALRPLTALLAGEADLKVKVGTIRALGRLEPLQANNAGILEKGGGMLAQVLASQARDREPAVRVEVMRALGRLGRVPVGQVERAGQVEGGAPLLSINNDFLLKAGGVLSEALADKEDSVREVAVWALGRLGSRQFERQLMDLLRFDGCEGVRVQAAMALGALKDKGALDELGYASEKDPSDRVRFCSRKAIADMTEPEETEGELPPIKLDEDVVTYQ
jgi:HEAT repeat protein/uncharacterized protein YfaP (DUF2135 family)